MNAFTTDHHQVLDWLRRCGWKGSAPANAERVTIVFEVGKIATISFDCIADMAMISETLDLHDAEAVGT